MQIVPDPILIEGAGRVASSPMTADAAPFTVSPAGPSNPTAPTACNDQSTRTSRLRVAASLVVFAVLFVAVWLRRDTIAAAVGELGGLGPVAIVLLLALAVYERWSRADIVRRLLGDPVGIRTGVVIHDVGTAASKGIPMGGALGTALRWQVAGSVGVRPNRFATMLIAYGIATTFVSWMLPLIALLVDLTNRPAEATDVVIVAVIVTVLTGSAAFWFGVLRSQRLESWAERQVRRIWTRVAGRVKSAGTVDPAGGVAEVRRSLHGLLRRPVRLLGLTALAQACGAVILFVALRSLGVGDELGTTEFFRVFFLAHLLGTFAPTPGGVGVVEAGLTGALMAAGVDGASALAGVLVYRFLTYVLPIAFGAALYAVWRARRVREPLAYSATMVPHGTPIDS